MSWILDHLNIVIVGILVIGSFLKSRFDSVKEDEPEAEDYPDFETFDQDERQSPPPVPYVPPMVERAPAVPPPISQPRPEFTNTRSVSGALTASAAEAAIILAKQREIEERMQAIRETRSANRPSKSPLMARSASRKSSPGPIGSVPASIRARLRNPAELRRAVILREILDRPVSLR